jgi:hypothetical protein
MSRDSRMGVPMIPPVDESKYAFVTCERDVAFPELIIV